MRNILPISFIVLILVLGAALVSSAHGAAINPYELLGIAEPSLLPDSPLYFFKNWGRGLRLFFAFDPLKKAELELRFGDEKLVEAIKLSQTTDQEEVLERALANYLEAQQRLETRLESLKGKNKNVDNLLAKLADRVLDHQQLFGELEEKFAEKQVKEAAKGLGRSIKKAVELDEKIFNEKLKARIKEEDEPGDMKGLEDELGDLSKDLRDLEQEALKERAEEALEAAEEEVESFRDLVAESGLTGGNLGRARQILELADMHWMFAKSAYDRNDLPGVDLHLRHVREFLEELKGVLEQAVEKKNTEIPEQMTVAIDTNGNFSPAGVKIKKGGTVIWINGSSKPVWPASAPHPTHQLYPGFDSLRGLAGGESYSFTFDKAGVWKYHDHLRPAVTGTVEVQD